MNIIRNSDSSMVTMPTSEYEVMNLLCEERRQFRNNFEHAYAELNKQGMEVGRLNHVVTDLTTAVAGLEGRNRDIEDEKDRYMRRTVELDRQMENLQRTTDSMRLEMDRMRQTTNEREISRMMRVMKQLIYGEMRRQDGEANEAGGGKRRKLVIEVYEDAEAALAEGDVYMYLFMKCEEASWRNDVGEVIRYAKLARDTIEKEREYRTRDWVNEPDRHPSWVRWYKRNQENWDRPTPPEPKRAEIEYWMEALGRKVKHENK